MVLAYHIVFCPYGFWMPNDPRGSWSDFVAAWNLYRIGGKATKVNTRQSLAGKQHDQQLRKDIQKNLTHKRVLFSGVQARAVGHGFAEVVSRYDYPIHACSILPDHIHIVIGRVTLNIRQVVRQLKQFATQHLKSENLYPIENPMLWGRGSWVVYLHDEEAVDRAIRYVEDNPIKDGKKRQQWKFVKPYPFSRRTSFDG